MSRQRTFPVWVPAGLVLLGGFAAVAAHRSPATPTTPPGFSLVAVVKGDGQGLYRDPIPESDGASPRPPRQNQGKVPTIRPFGGHRFVSSLVGRGLPGGAGVWLRIGPPLGSDLRGATAHGPGGETLPVQVGYQQRGLCLLTLPGGYPAGYGPVTLTLTDTQGQSASLSVPRLPSSFHAVTGRPTLRPTLHQEGLTLTVSAYRDPVPLYPGTSGPVLPRGVGYQVSATYPPGSEWKFRVHRAQLEWEALPPDQAVSGTPNLGYSDPTVFVAPFGTRLGVNPDAEASPRPRRAWIATPYGAYDHYLRLEGDLVHLASVEEKVTFHNLTVRAYPGRVPGAPSYAIDANPQTEVTPSGIFVSLLPLPNHDHLPGGQTDGAPPLIQIRLKLGPPPLDPGGLPGRFLTALPHSALSQKSHQPVRFTLRAERPDFGLYMLPVTDPADPRAFGDGFLTTLTVLPTVEPPLHPYTGGPFPPPKLLYAGGTSSPPKFLPTLTLIVTQEGEVQTTPVQFLVPITDQAPPDPYSQPARFPRFRRLP